MMLKKYTAIFFLAFASIVMLAFVVLPHHHHQEYLCFTTLHCENPSADDSHSHTKIPFQEHEGCVKILLQTQVSRIQSSVHSCDAGHCHHFIQTLFLVADILNFLSIEAENKTFSPVFYREKFYSAYYISDLSGRAPPFQG